MRTSIVRSFCAVLALWVTAAATPVHATTYSDAVLADNPLAYWRLNDVGPVVSDFSGNGRNGAVDGMNGDLSFGGPSLISTDPGNGSLQLGGFDRIIVPGFEKIGAGGYSAEYWIRVDQQPANCCAGLVSDGESGGDFFMMNYLIGPGQGTVGAIRNHFGTTNAPVSLTSSNRALQVGDVHHVVTTWDPTDPNNANGRIYIDGVLVAVANVSGNVPAPGTTGNNAIFIGRDGRENRPTNAVLDEIALYGTALSEAQIRAHYAAGSGKVPGLISYWNFDEASTGTATAIDQIDGNDGTFAGTATRTTGLIGAGAALFNDAGGDGVNVGPGNGNNFSVVGGITVEALFASDWSGIDQAEIFRKEDGGNRILLSFQAGPNINNAFGQLVGTAGTPGISLGLNVGGAYGELDIAFDGLDGRPTLAEVADGQMHHIVATYDAFSGDKAIYLDGELLGMVNLGPNMFLTSGGGAQAFIGNVGPGGGEPFDGVIDEVAFYGLALSPQDIQTHFERVQFGNNYFQPIIPEPMTAGLLGLGALALLGRRRRA